MRKIERQEMSICELLGSETVIEWTCVSNSIAVQLTRGSEQVTVVYGDHIAFNIHMAYDMIIEELKKNGYVCGAFGTMWRK